MQSRSPHSPHARSLEGLGAEQAAAVFLNCRNYWLDYGCADRLDEGITLYRTGVAHPQVNGVMWLGPGDLPRRIEAARERLDGVPWAWWVGPDSTPGTFEALQAAGATQVGAAPVMVVDTGTLAALPAPALDIEVLPPDADLTEWVAAYAPPMDIPASELPAMLHAETARSAPPGSLVRFAARVEGRIVAVSELYLRDGVAGIYLVATDARYRRKGYGAAVTTAAVQLGHARGARLATLQATPLGRPLYERLGFESVAEYRIMAFAQ